MLLIPCPYCGLRAETEFSYGGEAHIARPETRRSSAMPSGPTTSSCAPTPKACCSSAGATATAAGRWFNVARDTVTYEILAVYPHGREAARSSTPATYV